MNKLMAIPQLEPQISVCKTDAAWDATRQRAGLAWAFSRTPETAERQGAVVQNFVNSPLIAEALAVREGLFMAANQGISNLWMCSDNLTLIGAINNKTQRKELLGIVKDIHDLSSVFVSIGFFILVEGITRKRMLW